jgi:hypothetical protein
MQFKISLGKSYQDLISTNKLGMVVFAYNLSGTGA